jgi:hypothetical protein
MNVLTSIYFLPTFFLASNPRELKLSVINRRTFFISHHTKGYTKSPHSSIFHLFVCLLKGKVTADDNITLKISCLYSPQLRAGRRSRYSDWLRAGRSGDRIPVAARFSAPAQTGPGAHPTSCTMVTGSFPWVNSGWGVSLIPHHLLVSWS